MMRDRHYIETARGCSDAAVRRQLDRMLADPTFRRSERLRRFLRSVVEAHLDGNAAALKESAIAVEAFDKDADFDPRIDPIVRVEASRLRSRIDAYYAENPSDPIRIDLEKPGYRPVIRAVAVEQRTEHAGGSGLNSVSVVVLPLRDLSFDQSQAYLCEGVTERISSILYAMSSAFRVVALTSARRYVHGRDVRRIGRDLGADLVVEGSIQRTRRDLRVSARACRASNGFQIWSDIHDARLKSCLAFEDEVATWIAEALHNLREAITDDTRSEPLRRFPKAL